MILKYPLVSALRKDVGGFVTAEALRTAEICLQVFQPWEAYAARQGEYDAVENVILAPPWASAPPDIWE